MTKLRDKPPEATSSTGDHALVVLGCSVASSSGVLGLGDGAAARRVAAAAKAWALANTNVVIASGGRVWSGRVEADAMASGLVALGVPEERIVRERLSFTTRENARFVAAQCAKRGIGRVAIVTCVWHLSRAAKCFEAEGLLVVERISAGERAEGWVKRTWIRGRERILATLVTAIAVSAMGAIGCANERRETAPLVTLDADAPAVNAKDIARAEDRRRAKDVSQAARTNHDVSARRLAARALARIADADSAEGLLRALEDEDVVVAAWGAYGLGMSCKGHEEVYVRALAARATSYDGDAGPTTIATVARDAIDPREAIARAVGRCGGATAEATLAAWVRRRDVWSEMASYALGDVAAKRGALGDETMTALIEGANSPSTRQGANDAALYPFARLERVPDAFAPRVAKAALAKMAHAGTARTFAVRALGRTGATSAPDVERIVLDPTFTPAERADAARALRGMGDDGHAAAADALAQLVPSKDPLEISRVGGDDYGVLTSLVASLGNDVPKKSEPGLFLLAALVAPGTPPVSLARRLAELRCGAAAALAKGAYDSDVLKHCDIESSEAAERARLSALTKRSLVADRRTAWRALTKSDHVKVREAALEAIGDHPELADVGRAALADALAAKKGGIVATAAEVIHGHPDRVMVLSDREKRAALDPAIAQALGAALDRAWPEDLVETRASLLDAAVAVSFDRARAAAKAACQDPNATMRERATKALRDLGDDATACPAPADAGAPAPEIDRVLAHDTRVTLTTDAGDLVIVFEPSLTPIASTRFVALAKAGFYDGIVVHRVVPGFVAQFGDPDGDGYGGAGSLLRCETSPVPFGALDVGVALAGRDTGSSQLFVTLARVPHLDGEYARVGRAEGDWWALAEGDVIRSVKVEP
jgi:cyclophilin family peptidyl-prolyl cis-trans isomerase